MQNELKEKIYKNKKKNQPVKINVIKNRAVRSSMILNPEIVEIYCDGACKGNPGPGGWGVYVGCASSQCNSVKAIGELGSADELWGQQDNKDILRVEIYGGSRYTTNNKMELRAAIESVKVFISNKNNKNKKLVLYTDSQYVVKGMNEWRESWEKNNFKGVKNMELWMELIEYVKKIEADFVWVKGHSNNPGNNYADYLANLGIDLLSKSSHNEPFHKNFNI